MEISDIKEKRLKSIKNYIAKMPSLSTTVTKVLEICDSPKTSPGDLKRVISLDPVLTGQVLMLINSAYYSLHQKVTSLTKAIIMLGLNTVVNLAVSTAVLESLDGKGTSRSVFMDNFWTHSFCVGVTAKLLAAIKGIPGADREEYFVAGLLHDLGKIPLSICFSSEYRQVLDSAKRKNVPLHRAENIIFGIDHCAVGKMIADKWQLSESINDSLRFHHYWNSRCEKENSQFIEIVSLANIFANIFEVELSGNIYHENTHLTNLLERVGIRQTELYELRNTVLDEVEKAKIFLLVTKKG